MDLRAKLLEAVRGWSTVEIVGRRLPNGSLFRADQGSAQLSFVEYIFCNPDLADKFRDAKQAEDHYRRHGRVEGRQLRSGEVDPRFERKLARGEDASPRHTRLRYPTRGHALRFNGLINDDFLRHFDHEFYRDNLKLFGLNEALPTREHCVVHFCEIGINLALPISERHRSDAAFYSKTRLDRAAPDNPVGEPRWLLSSKVETFFSREILADRPEALLREAALLRHWVNVGLPSGMAPNLLVWIQSTFGVYVPKREVLGLDDYLRGNGDVALLDDPRQQLTHLLEHGLAEQRGEARLTPLLCRLSWAWAQRLREDGEAQRATRLSDRLTALCPEHRGLALPAARSHAHQHPGPSELAHPPGPGTASGTASGRIPAPPQPGAISKEADRLARPALPASAAGRDSPKILIVNVFYPPQAVGGATRVVHDNVTDLKRLYGESLTLEVFTTRQGAGEPYQVQAYVFDGVRVTAVVTPHDSELDRRFVDPRMGQVFRDYLAESCPELIHFHCIQRLGVNVVDAARELGIPYLITAHDGWWISDRQFLIDEDDLLELYHYGDPEQVRRELGSGSLARQNALAPALSDAAAILPVSEPFADIYRKAGVTKVRAVPNGVSDLPEGVRTAPSDRHLRLGHLGGVARHKGLPLLKRALERGRFSNLRLLAIDHGLTGYEVEDVWGDTLVRLVPPVPSFDVGTLYANIDVLVAPSVWPESYGLVTREAAALGCWVVASDAGNIAEPVVPGENGFIVRAGDADDLARVLGELDAHPEHYLVPPAPPQNLRSSADQARELHDIYRSILLGQGAAICGS